MTTRRRLALALAALLAAVAGCSDDALPAPAADDLPRPAVADDAGAPLDDAGDAAVDAEVDAGLDAEAGTTEPGEPPPVCAKGATWAAPATLGLADVAGPLLASISADGLTMVWATQDAPAGTVRFADRASAADAFGAPTVLSGTYALERVAVSSDGLALVLVTADGRAFVERARPSRGAPFGAAVSGAMQNIDDDAAAMPAGERLGDPVLAPGDRAFVYSRHGAGRTRTIHVAYRLFGNDTWPVGQPIAANAALDATGGRRRRPTALSVDGRTLFFFDEVTSASRAGWIGAAPDDFTDFEDLPLLHATVDASCAKLYGATPLSAGVTQSTGGAGTDVLGATRL